MKHKSIFICATVLLLFACQNEKNPNLIDISPDITYTDVRTNKVNFPEVQDYIKNLDFTLLEKPDANPIHMELLGIFKALVEGENHEIIISNLVEILSRTEHAILIQIYTQMIELLLFENGAFDLAYDNFPQDEIMFDINYALKDFPETSLAHIDSVSLPLKGLKN